MKKYLFHWLVMTSVGKHWWSRFHISNDIFKIQKGKNIRGGGLCFEIKMTMVFLNLLLSLEIEKLQAFIFISLLEFSFSAPT